MYPTLIEGVNELAGEFLNRNFFDAVVSAELRVFSPPLRGNFPLILDRLDHVVDAVEFGSRNC